MQLLPATLLFMFQTAGAIDKLLDELFNSTPARLIFIVMIVSVASIPIMLIIFLLLFQRTQTANAASQTRLVGVIDNLQKYINEAQEHNSENYLMVKAYIEQIVGMFTTISASIVSNQAAANAGIKAQADLLLQTSTLHAETRANIQGYLSNQLEATLERILDQRRIDIFEDFQTPPDDDCRYKMRVVRAAETVGLKDGEQPPDITLYKAPIFRDGNESGKLRGSGEIVNIITDTVFPGWVYIKQLYGAKGAGYARARNLSIIELPASNTNQLTENKANDQK